MARKSENHNLTKVCGCVRWKECAHPFWVEYEYVAVGAGGRERRRLNRPLAGLVGREPKDFADAIVEAKRAIVAFRDGGDARSLLPGDAPTLAQVIDAYGERPDAAAIDPSQRKMIVTTVVRGRAFGEWRAGEVTREMLEAFRKQRGRVAGNRDLALLRAAFNWAVLLGLVPSTPFKIAEVPAVKLRSEEPRSRRLVDGEEPGLRRYASAYLEDLIDGALATACRQGELLSLQWHQVLAAELFLPGGKTKSKKPRRVPISAALRKVLERRRRDPAGELLPADAFVFGDELGRPRPWNKRAWEKLVLRAHGMQPRPVVVLDARGRKQRKATLTPECRAALKRINLHFHDLRREGASRWMDAGVALATIQRWLGHANIAQTSTYLAASGGNDAVEMAAFEARQRAAAAAGGSGAPAAPDQQSGAPAPAAGGPLVDNGLERQGSSGNRRESPGARRKPAPVADHEFAEMPVKSHQVN